MDFGLVIDDCRLKKFINLRKVLADRRGYSMTFWAVFFGFVMIPIMALGIEVGRYFYAKAEIAKAADAAALAAAAQINQAAFEQSGVLTPTGATWSQAQAFANMNDGPLDRYGVFAIVTSIQVDPAMKTVSIGVSADLRRLFPSVVPAIIVTETGSAGIQAFSR